MQAIVIILREKDVFFGALFKFLEIDDHRPCLNALPPYLVIFMIDSYPLSV